MPSNILSFSIDKTQKLPIIPGNTTTFNLSIKNLSLNTRLYNLALYLNLPDGLVLSTSTIPQTSSITNLDNSILYSWINLKDLAPFEFNYTFSITVKCNTKFKNGTNIAFGYDFSGISVSCEVDTMPRGNYDIGNEKITQGILMSFETIRFSSIISTSGKVLKGAGTSPALDDYTQVNTATCKFSNNALSSSLVNISILLENGIRYIGNTVSSGTDSTKFSSPTVNLVSINNKLYTQIYYGAVNLSTNSNTTLTFNYAIWNKYSNNQGDFILHGTDLNMYINMTSADPLITSTSNSSTSFSAMDLIITTSINKSLVDVQNNIIYTYVYKVGQYYNIKNIAINYLLPDGIFYISSSTNHKSAVDTPNLQGFYITYNFPLAIQNSITSININAKVDSYYRYKKDSDSLNLPVVASDSFLAITDISATLIEKLDNVSDNANVTSSIGIGSITKQFIKGYYRNGDAKTINTLAPGDLAEYRLSYNASNLKALQKQIYIDDFFPLSAEPINNLMYEYKGILPISDPGLIDPHGVDFYYGDIPGLSSSSITFKVPIKTLGSSSQNTNLMKLKGLNTYGYSYSSRSQVVINIGKPNITLTKSISGPNLNAIQANETYYYTITITNTNNLGTETDAFNFNLSDSLSSWFTVNKDSLTTIGNGNCNPPTLDGNNILVYINKLSPGEFITLKYSVIVSPVISPSVNITTTATNTNPYSQKYGEGLDNFQYTGLTKIASSSMSSFGITLTKTNTNDVFKIGSPITYTITATVPKGTIAYDFYIKDILPSGGQIYVGPAYKNGALVNPTVSSNIVTFSSEGTIDARLSAQTITLVINCKITNSNKSVNTLSSTQTNTVQCLYRQIEGGSFTTISKTLAIKINHPNILLNLSATDTTNSVIYSQNANINTNSIIQFKLLLQNNSSVALTNGTIEVPIDTNFIFSSINTTIQCNAVYNATSKKIIINIPQLDPSIIGFIIFTVIPRSTLKAGTYIDTKATAISYYNDISSSKIYSGEKSNVLSCALPPNISLMPNPENQINDSTSFIVTPPGNTCIIINYFKNTGAGYDDFSLSIQPVALPYTLYVDNEKIGDILPNTLYKEDLDIMKNLAPNTNKTIAIRVPIPISEYLGNRYDFIVNVKSKTTPYPEKTVLNIDPS